MKKVESQRRETRKRKKLDDFMNTIIMVKKYMMYLNKSEQKSKRRSTHEYKDISSERSPCNYNMHTNTAAKYQILEL